MMNKVIALVGLVCLFGMVSVFGHDGPEKVPNEPKITHDENSPFHPKLEWRGLLSKAVYKVTVLTKHQETNGRVLYITLVQVGTPGSATEYQRVYKKTFTTLRFPIKKGTGKGYIYIPASAIEGLKIELISSLHNAEK